MFTGLPIVARGRQSTDHLPPAALLFWQDSCYAMMECERAGHEIVALANLLPAAGDDGEVADDIDSFMYQTVGHNMVGAVARCMELPLLRRATRGRSVRRTLAYVAPPPPPLRCPPQRGGASVAG